MGNDPANRPLAPLIVLPAVGWLLLRPLPEPALPEAITGPRHPKTADAPERA